MTAEAIAFLVFAPLLFATVWLMPKWWRNERGLHTDTPPPWWPWSRASWRALVRAWMPLAISALIGEAASVVMMLAAEGPLWVGANVLAVTGVLIWAFVIPAVVLFNRPRCLLAPHHRALPGWLSERRGTAVPPVPEPAKPPRWHTAAR